MHVAHCIPNFRAVFSNEQSDFIWPYLAHELLNYASTFKNRDGMHNNVTVFFVQSKIRGHGYRLVTRAMAKHNRDIELLWDFHKIMKDFKAPL